MVNARSALHMTGCVLGLMLTLSACDGRTGLTSVPEPPTTLLARFAGAVPVVDSVEAVLVVNSQVSKVSKVAYASGAHIGLGNVAHGANYNVTVRGIKAGGISRWWASSSPATATLSTESASLQVVQGPQAPSAVYDSLTVPSHITLPAGVIYTVDGSDPRTSVTAQVAASAIAVTSAKTIFAAVSSPAQAATGQPMLWSDLGSWTFIAVGAVGTVAQPTFTPSTGSYTGAQSVSLSTATSGASIYYTMNGDQPSTASTWYSGSAIPVSMTTTIKAIAVKSGMNPSSVAVATFTITTAPTGTTFTDTRDGQVYNMVKIGTQTWMSQNLNFSGTGIRVGVCYQNSIDSCSKYGRLYTWAEVMAGASSSASIPSGVQGVCPSGWHVPSDTEWNLLSAYVDARTPVANVVGKALKSKSGWLANGSNSGNGTDQFGFQALPGGENIGSYGSFQEIGRSAHWHTATNTSVNRDSPTTWTMGNASDIFGNVYGDGAGNPGIGYSLRCIAN